MKFLKGTLSLLIWLLLYIPTTVFVLFILIKSLFKRKGKESEHDL